MNTTTGSNTTTSTDDSSITSNCSRIQKLVQNLSRNGLNIQPMNEMNLDTNSNSNRNEGIMNKGVIRRLGTDIDDNDRVTTMISATSPAISDSLEKENMIIPVECKICSTDPSSTESQCRAYVSSPVVCNSSSENESDSNPPLIDGIVLCANRLASRQEKEEALLHELVHVYDAYVKRLNLRRCEDLAYSEVRAAREAECNFRAIPFFMRRPCVREKATNATTCMFSGDKGRVCVNQVFDKAFNDMSGFQDGKGDKPKSSEIRYQKTSER